MARRSTAESSPRLGVPELFAPGPYEQVLILTFGADLEFYERVLRRHFGSFRNQIVLADGGQLDRHLSGLASSGTLRHLNRSWVAGPVRIQHSAHAKAILLAGPEAGLLLVGSGNLSLQGYAGAGECFVPYRWGPDQPDDLHAFTNVRSLADTLVERALVDPVIADRLKVFWSAYDWWHALPTDDGPVRHNLDRPLGTQFVDAVAGEAVEELTVVAPFHDERCAALEHLIAELNPVHVRVLVQPGRCSVDAAQLQRVLDTTSGTVHSITAAGDHELSYLHAKVILAKTARRAVCLVGSANCSQVALWLKQPGANVEIGSLLTGPPSAFNHLLESSVVTIGPAVDPSQLDLEIRDDGDSEDAESLPPTIHDLEINGDTLSWTMVAPGVGAEDVVIEVDGHVAPTDITMAAADGGRNRWAARLLDPDDVEAVRGVAVVAVRIGDLDPSYAVPYQVERLREQDRRRVDADRLRHAARLELDDPDLEQALAALEEILVGDNVARWGKDRTPSDEADNSESIAWENIDWSAVRRHPRFQAYGGLAGFGAPGSALADYLAALSQLVRELLDEEDITGPESAPDAPTGPDDEEEETDVASGVEGADPDEEDEEDDELDEEPRRQSPAARNRRLVRNFVRRNLAVLEQPGFRDGAGPGIVIPNLIILNWVCWWIATKDEDHGPELVDERLRLWELLWGNAEDDGYLATLDDEHQALVLERFDAQRFEAVIAASVADVWASIPTVTETNYRRLRAVIRRSVCSPCWQVTALHLDAGAVLTNKRPTTVDPLDASEIAERMWEVACAPHFAIEIRSAVAAALGCLPGDVTASSVEVIVDGRSDRRSVDQMEVSASVTSDGVETALAAWMGLADLDFYRLKWPGGVAFYNTDVEAGWVVPDDGDERTIDGSLKPAYPRWRDELDRLADSVVVRDEVAA